MSTARVTKSDFSVSVVGIDECVNALNGLYPNLAKAALRNACKKAMAPVLEKAKELVPVRYGFLKRWLVSKAKTGKDGKTFYCMVGVERGHTETIDVATRGEHKGDAVTANPARYAHLVELGSSTREATPFLRPALAIEAVNAIDIFQTEIEREIDGATLKQTYGGITK